MAEIESTIKLTIHQAYANIIVMNLHRTEKSPQWDTIRPEERNPFQKVAAKTQGVVTPANAVSAIGAGMVAAGLRDISKGEVTKGSLKVGAGRIADVIDGTTAEKTGTKSPLGEGVDVVIDKVETAAALPVLVRAGILPKPTAAMIFSQNLANTAFSAVAKRRGVELHPSREGKLATFGQWATIGFHGLAAAAKENDYQRLGQGLEIAGHVSAIATAALGAKAIEGYARESLQTVPEPQA